MRLTLKLAIAGSLLFDSAVAQEMVEVLQAREGLERFCAPGSITSDGRGCDACPAITGSRNGGAVQFTGSVRGHFTMPGREELLVSTLGCEPRSRTDSGTVLLSRAPSGAWTYEWYQHGLASRDCRKVRSTAGTDWLVCTDAFERDGFLFQSLEYIRANERAANRSTQLFAVVDTTGTCGHGAAGGPDAAVTDADIERFELEDLNGDGLMDVRVTLRFARRRLTEFEGKRCGMKWDGTNRPVRLLSQRYEIDFVQNTGGFAATPASQRLIERLGICPVTADSMTMQLDRHCHVP